MVIEHNGCELDNDEDEVGGGLVLAIDGNRFTKVATAVAGRKWMTQAPAQHLDPPVASAVSRYLCLQ